MPTRSQTAPRRSSRVDELSKTREAVTKQAADKADALKKKEEAEARNAKAGKGGSKSKGKKTVQKRRTAKRKAEEEEEEEEKEVKKPRGAPKARGGEAKDTTEAEEEDPKKKGGKYSVGDVVEDVTLRNEDDEDVSLKSLYEEKGLVIFSYPKANTPGCTTQACNFRDTSSAFTSHNFTVLGLSRDKPSAQMNWKSKHELGYSLLSDPEAGLLMRLGATEGQKRCHWIIEKGGKLLEAKIGVKPADDAKNALEFVKALSFKKDDDEEDKEEENADDEEKKEE
ncbi:hypothetical protein JCM8547_007531 [Rhodosporidiobolus lusitaniae]